MKNNIINKVLSIINSVEHMNITSEQIEENLQDMGMDSLTFIQIVIGLEIMFDCEIPDNKLLISEMDTVQKMVDIIQALNTKETSKALASDKGAV